MIPHVLLVRSDQNAVQCAKLKAILCYFERASEGQCNLSGVVTYRRKVRGGGGGALGAVGCSYICEFLIELLIVGME